MGFVVIEDSAQSVVQAGVPADASSPTAEITVYDFERSATLSREHARALELAFETFSRQWSADLSAKIRVRATVSVENVRMQTYGEYAQSLPTTTALVVCALPDSAERVIVQFPPSAATAWIVQMVGGRPTGSTPEERTFTPIEQALIGTLMRDAIELLTKTTDGLLPQGISISGIQYNSQFAQVAAAAEPVIVARLAMRLGGRSVPTSVMLPASILSMFRNAAADDSSSPELVRRQVEETPIELALRLSARTMLPREVLGLSVGDIVPMPHSADRPLLLLAGDHPIATAAVGTSGARLACVVTTTVSDPASEESA